MKNKKGFTLVEVIVVLVILAILAAIMIPSMTGWIDKAKSEGAYTEIRECALAARSAYEVVYGKYESAGSENQYFYPDGGSTTADIEFRTEFENFINDANILANVKFVGASTKFISVVYTYNGTDYRYMDDNGTVTITKA